MLAICDEFKHDAASSGSMVCGVWSAVRLLRQSSVLGKVPIRKHIGWTGGQVGLID